MITRSDNLQRLTYSCYVRLMSETNETPDEDRYYLKIVGEAVWVCDSLADQPERLPARAYSGPDRLLLAGAALDRLNATENAGTRVPAASLAARERAAALRDALRQEQIDLDAAVARLSAVAREVGERTAVVAELRERLAGLETALSATETAQDASRVVRDTLEPQRGSQGSYPYWRYLAGSVAHIGPVSPPASGCPGTPHRGHTRDEQPCSRKSEPGA